MSDDIQQGGAHEPDDLSDVEQLLRELDNEDLQLVAPPPDVWEGIDRAIRSEPGAVVPLQRQRSRRRSWLIAAAVIVALAASAVVVAVRRDGDEPVVATAVLTHDAATFDPRGAGAAATARLLDGHRRRPRALADRARRQRQPERRGAGLPHRRLAARRLLRPGGTGPVVALCGRHLDRAT
jgi:hypothetical protein